MATPEDWTDHVEIIAEFTDTMPSNDGPCYTLKEGEGPVEITIIDVFMDSAQNPSTNGTGSPGDSPLPDQKS